MWMMEISQEILEVRVETGEIFLQKRANKEGQQRGVNEGPWWNLTRRVIVASNAQACCVTLSLKAT